MSFLTRGKPKTSGQSGTATSQIDPRAFSGWGKDEEIPGYEWVASEFKDLYDKGYQPFQQKNEFGQMVDVTGMDMMGVVQTSGTRSSKLVWNKCMTLP